MLFTWLLPKIRGELIKVKKNQINRFKYSEIENKKYAFELLVPWRAYFFDTWFIVKLDLAS